MPQGGTEEAPRRFRGRLKEAPKSEVVRRRVIWGRKISKGGHVRGPRKVKCRGDSSCQDEACKVKGAAHAKTKPIKCRAAHVKTKPIQ